MHQAAQRLQAENLEDQGGHIESARSSGPEEDLLNPYRANRVTTLLANVAVSFEEVGGHDVCRVDVTPSRKPVYATGKQTKDFFVRLNNGTRSLDVEEAFDYISSHDWSGG
jgi:hypothetical protein